MTGKKKPVKVVTKTRASQNNQTQIENSATDDLFQCPYCGYQGKKRIFKHGWIELLHMLVAKHEELGAQYDLPSMSLEDQFGLYLRLSRL